jgi:hypothetical protein
MEALKAAEDPEDRPRIRELQQQWRQAADVPRAQGEALWRRFKAAHDESGPAAKHTLPRRPNGAGNLAKKIALCERAEALAGSTNWMQTAEEIKRLQADWKRSGRSHAAGKAVWERFHVACDRFFTRRHEDLAAKGRGPRTSRRRTRCARGRALAESTDWDRRGRAPAPPGRVEDDRPGQEEPVWAIWQRFRGAAILFHAVRTASQDRPRGALAAREAICAELSAFAARTDGRRAGAPRQTAPAPGLDAGGGCGCGGGAAPDLLATVRSLARAGSRSSRSAVSTPTAPPSSIDVLPRRSGE